MLARRTLATAAVRSRASPAMSTMMQSAMRLSRDDSITHNEGRIHHRTTPLRHYHATQRREIVPLIAAGAVVMIGRWSWKAMGRMDQEWADYQWELEQWERKQARSGDQAIPTTIGVDVGTIYNKVASTYVGQPTPTLLETPQGERLRFVTTAAGSTGEASILSGATAMDKFFYKPSNSSAEGQVSLPYQRFVSDTASLEEASKIVSEMITPSVAQVMERVEAAATSVSQSSRLVRTVVAMPPKLYNQYSEAIEAEPSTDDSVRVSGVAINKEVVVVPDPIAAVWGAQSIDCIASPTTKDDVSSQTCLVVDIGGLETTLSLVEGGASVTSFATIPNVGGEALVQQLVDRVVKETAVTDSDGNETATLANDPMSLALISKEARQAVLELVHKTNVDLHIPYLLMGQPDKSDDPHFRLNLSRTVLEQATEDRWRDTTYPELMYGSDEPILSPNLPPPTNVSTLLSSVATKLLEDAGRTPGTIDHVLVVGGGSRHPFLQKAAHDGLAMLFPPECYVCPEPSTVRAELTAVGAASLLPSQTYTYYDGLKRVENN